MFNFFKKQKAKPYNWKKEQTRLWGALVPATGQADTLQGELIRISGKLTDQAFRNGNMNWDADHERMWRFIGRHLDDPATFTNKEGALIREKIEEIIRDNETPDVAVMTVVTTLSTRRLSIGAWHTRHRFHTRKMRR
jgi:hypothetical protein